MGKEEILNKLEELNIEYKIVEHEPVHTIEDMEKLEGNPFDGVEVCKNLFLRDQKGKRHFLIVVCQNKKVDLDKLKDSIYSTRLSFGSAERLMNTMGLEQGYVSPMGLINDKDEKVEVFFDKDLKNKEIVAVHPNTNEATLILNFKDVIKFVEFTKHEFDFINI